MEKKSKYHVVSVNHIDLGFVKRKEEQAELLEIWVERMISVCERFPELKFAIEQAYHYRGLKDRRPDLFQKVKHLIGQGRIEMMGGMVSSMDTNFVNGESFVRNQSIGLQWVKENLGTVPKAAWLVDTFGINAQIPQLLRQYGFEVLFANRFGGKIPYDLFKSRGIDGSEIIVSGRDLACRQILPYSQAFVFCRGWNDAEQLFRDADGLKGDLPRLVVFYLENEEVLSTHYRDLTLERQARDGEDWRFSSYGAYLDELLKNPPALETVHGDLNPEFTGTFALRTPIKLWNRRAEAALLESEQWDALLHLGLSKELESLWWDMGYVQFHDVFSGSHEDCTYLDLINTLENVVQQAKDSVKAGLPLKQAPDSIVCLNPLPFSRQEWVELPSADTSALQVFQNDKQLLVEYDGNKTYCLAELPPAGMTQLSLRKGEVAQESSKASLQPCEACTLQNKWITMRLHRDRGIDSLTADGLLMQEVRDFLTVQHDMGSMQIEEAFGEELSVMDGHAQLTFTENQIGQRAVYSGDLRSMDWNNGDNFLHWEVEFSLPRYRAVVGVRIRLDWKGEATRIRFKVPHLVNASRAVYEIPFGTVDRYAYDGHSTAKGEWPAHRFVAAEDQKQGIALINRGVAGVELCGGGFETTLLRAFPDQPGTWVPVTPLTSQHGQHSYEFAIMPYCPGELPKVAQMAQQINQPVQTIPGVALEAWAEGSWLSISESSLVLSSIKAAGDGSGDMIIRYYETAGVESEAQLFLRGAQEVWLSNVTEELSCLLAQGTENISVRCRPYEIQTLRMKR